MVIVTKFHQNRFNGSWDMLCWQKEEEEEERKKNARETGHIRLQRMCKEETSEKQDPAGVTGRVRRKKKEETSKIQDPAGVSGRVTRDICVCKQTLVHRRIFYDERNCFCRCWDSVICEISPNSW